LFVGFATSASWASQSLSASYAPGGVNFTGKTNGTVPVWNNNNLSDSSSLSADAWTISVNRTASSSEVCYVRGTASISSNFIGAFVHSTNTYAQVKVQNFDVGNSASADLILESDKSTESFGYVDIGINSSTYAVPEFSLGGALDGYIYTVGSGSVGGDFTVGTLSDGRILFHVSGSRTTDEKFRISKNSISASVPISGSLLGTASFSISASYVQPLNVFSRGGAFTDANGLAGNSATNQILPLWVAPFDCTLTALKTTFVSGSGATVNARKNFTNAILTASAPSTNGSWASYTSFATSSITAGDSVAIFMVSSSGNPVAVVIQLDFTR
jgi:hypothetical protein